MLKFKTHLNKTGVNDTGTEIMQSPNNTVVSLPDQGITDALGNTWSIIDRQVAVNGVIDPTTANVIQMAYENGWVWQKNADNLWWSKSSPNTQWSPPYGTNVDPIPGQYPSNNDTVLVAGPTGIIQDAQANAWTIVNGQVVINGVPDPTTARVVQLVLSGGEVWQENADGLWWVKSSPNGSWNPPLGTNQAPVPDPKTATNTVKVVMSSLSGPITDASGNHWAIVNGQITLNGVADQTTRNVVEIAYVNGHIWQENADGLWWSKSTPADQWSPPLGMSQSPLPGGTHVWGGEDANFSTASDWTGGAVPHRGDTAVITAGRVSVNAGAAGGVNFAMQGGSVDFDGNGTNSIGTLSGSGSVQLSYVNTTTTLSTSGIKMSGDSMSVAEFATTAHSNFVVTGPSTISAGSALDVYENGTASLPLGEMENDGGMILSGSTLYVGQLKGSGSITLTNNAQMTVQTSSASSDTIALESGHLFVGSYPSFSSSAGMAFLSPVTNFGDNATLQLVDIVATQEVYHQISATSAEMQLYNGTTEVADLHLSGQSHFYASILSGGPGPSSVLVTGSNGTGGIPIVSHVS
jgi:hypothetical protein